MKVVETVTTEALTVGDSVQWTGGTATVTAVSDTGRGAFFGSGTEYRVVLATVLGERDMAAAASQKWTRV